jgi:hypothetical protein
MNSEKLIVQHVRIGFITILFTLLFLPAVVLAGDDTETIDYFFDVPGEGIAAPITVVLDNLQPTNHLPHSAQPSVIAESNRKTERTHIGARVPTWAVEGGKAWMKSRLITRERALIQVQRITEDGEFVQAGFNPPEEPSGHRTPWITLIASGDHRWADGILEIQSRSEAAQSVTLLEVVAIDAEHIYFAGITINGEEILLSAAYSYSFAPDKFRPSEVTALAAGTP